MPGFIPDASVTLPWRFEDEATPWTDSLLDRIQQGEQAVVPDHWPLEVLNSLLVAERRSRLPAEKVNEFIEDLVALPIRIEHECPPMVWPSLVAIARKHRLTIYDAAYLELAIRVGLPLATLDRDLQKAARAENVPLIESDQPNLRD